jgi:hypothetical protein
MVRSTRTVSYVVAGATSKKSQTSAQKSSRFSTDQRHSDSWSPKRTPWRSSTRRANAVILEPATRSGVGVHSTWPGVSWSVRPVHPWWSSLPSVGQAEQRSGPPW